MTVSSNKHLESTNECDLQEIALLAAMHRELLGTPGVYELLDTYLSEYICMFVERSVVETKICENHGGPDRGRRRRRVHRMFYTLDVLNDGSEYTGHGTLFLTVWKSPPCLHSAESQSQHDDDHHHPKSLAFENPGCIHYIVFQNCI
jgi:hypothetical protein